MKFDFCVLCGTTENLHHHHVVPKVEGGSDDEENILTLCDEHHADIHQIRKGSLIYELARKGREKAKESGVKFGRKISYTPKVEERILTLRSTYEYGYGTLSKIMNMPRATIQSIINRQYYISLPLKDYIEEC